MNIKENFKDIIFYDFNHTYKLNGELLPSVSSKVSQFKVPFDKGVAKFSAIKQGITEQEVLANWEKTSKDACDFGSKVHLFAEEFIQKENVVPSNDPELGIIQFFNDNPQYEIVEQELVVYNKNYKYAGTIDLVLRNKETGNIVLGDWKTNKDLHKNYKGKKLICPFDKYLETPLNGYKIQLNLYDMCLESFNIPVEKRLVIWLTKNEETNKNYIIYEVEDLKPILKLYYGNN